MTFFSLTATPRGVLEGRQPLFSNPSPSPLKERGIKGVR